MGERGSGGACPSPAGSLQMLGVAISFCAFVLEGLLIVRGAGRRIFRVLPVFYSYIIFCFSGFVGVYLVYWLDRQVYPSAYWIYYLVSILVQFAVLVEVSDCVFRPFPAIRSLGRAFTILIASGLGLVYILPSTVGSTGRSRALLDFALRASVTKAIILAVLFYVSQHYGCRLGRDVGGLMLGFSIYVGLDVALWASAKAFGPVLFARLLWFMEPLAYALCLLVWTISLWEIVPVPSAQTISTVAGRDSRAVALGLTRFNSKLSKILHK